MEDVHELKIIYGWLKSKGNKERQRFLEQIVQSCKYLNFTYCETIILLGIVRNCVPIGDMTWACVEEYDDFDENFNKELRQEWILQAP